MTTVLLLLLASTITGAAADFFFRVWSLLAGLAGNRDLVATVLQTFGFAFCTGIPIVVGCLIAGQVAYLAATLFVHRGELSMQDDADGDPGMHGHRHVDEENE